MLAAIAPILAGCDEANPARASAQPSPIPKSASSPSKPQPRAIVRELPGRIAPTRVAEVRPRVSGIVLERLFQQGSDVKAGDALPHRSQAVRGRAAAAEAALAKARGGARCSARQQARRMSTAERPAGHLRRRENEMAMAADAPGRGRRRGAARPTCARAKLNLEYATVRAPINGRIGRALVTEGALVGAERDHQLRHHPAARSDLCRLHPIGRAKCTRCGAHSRAAVSSRIAPDAAKVRLVLDNGTLYPLAGKLLFSDASVDPGTGQVTLARRIPQSRSANCCRACMCACRSSRASTATRIAVPQQAIQRNNGGGSEVFVVKDDNRAVAAAGAHRARAGRAVVVHRRASRPATVSSSKGFQKFVSGDNVDAATGAGPTRTQRAPTSRAAQPSHDAAEPDCMPGFFIDGRSSPGSSRCSSAWSARSRFRYCRWRSIRSSRRPRSRSRPAIPAPRRKTSTTASRG